MASLGSAMITLGSQSSICSLVMYPTLMALNYKILKTFFHRISELKTWSDILKTKQQHRVGDHIPSLI